MTGPDGRGDGVPPDFDRLYRADPDPWEVATSWYERRKIAVVLACLRRERYAVGWDAACGTGHLSAELARRCDHVLATDASTAAVALTKALAAELTAATTGTPSVDARVSCLPAAPPQGPAPDLIVLSEVLYYLPQEQREQTYRLVDEIAAPDADVVGVHWRPRAEDFLVPGAHVHRELGDALVDRGWTRVVTHTDEEFLVGVWSRALPDRVGR